MKRFIALFLTIAMLLTVVPVAVLAVNDGNNGSAAAETRASSGTCGKKLTWTLENGTLTISGSGSMTDYTPAACYKVKLDGSIEYLGDGSSAPWSGRLSDIYEVVIEDGVKSIGRLAFKGLVNVTSVTIPVSVKEIFDYAFDGCSGLKNIFYTGTERQWQTIKINSNNAPLSVVDIQYLYGHEHTWNDGEITTAASCTSEGVKTYTCQTCGTTRTEAIPATGHSYAAVVTEATCTVQGYTTYTCSGCGSTYTVDYVSPMGHSWDDGNVTTAPICTAEGVKTYTCQTCGEKRTETIPMTEHSWDGGIVTTSPSCTAEGVKTYTCQICGEKRTETIPMTAHTWDNGRITTVATAAVEGVKTYTCSVCGAKNEETIPATGKAPNHTGTEGNGSNPFDDVQETDYFCRAVLWGYENGIVYGTSDMLFSPEESCTRGQAITFLYRAAGEPDVSGMENPFTDVQKRDYFYRAVLWGYENGIVSGVTDTTFLPDAKVTRAQFLTFLWRYAGKPDNGGKSCSFTDLQDGQYYTAAVKWGYQEGLAAGLDSTHFGPDDSCTRGQVVTFLYRDMGTK